MRKCILFSRELDVTDAQDSKELYFDGFWKYGFMDAVIRGPRPVTVTGTQHYKIDQGQRSLAYVF
jgi:hypothetical protein